jgi:hypothetical protein
MTGTISEYRANFLTIFSIPPEETSDGDFPAFIHEGIFIGIGGKTSLCGVLVYMGKRMILLEEEIRFLDSLQGSIGFFCTCNDNQATGRGIQAVQNTTLP